MAYHLEFITPEKIVISAEIESIIAPGIEGYFGVLERHTYFVTPLAPGTVTVRREGAIHYYDITGGFCEVTPEKVVILASTASVKTDPT